MTSDGNRETTQGRFGAGIDDAIILPLVLSALALARLCRALLTILIHILDYAFPVLLQVMRFPLFTLRIIGDGLAALTRGVIGYMPVSITRRAAWRDAVSRYWSWLRQRISYKAFEEAVHHLFERGMALVFRTCRTLTPRDALLVLFGAVLWLPVSFGVATAIHAVLIAKATTLPAWMQLGHGVATVIAKSKLLVLPVYPAAWPRAKQHPVMQAMFRSWRFLAGLHFTRKTGHRYRQARHAAEDAADAIGRTASRVGLRSPAIALLNDLNRAAAWIAGAVRAAASWSGERLSRVPLLGAIVSRYAAHYERAEQQPPGKLSEKVGGFFERWSLKFSAEYYEAKEREETAKRQAIV